MIKKFLLLVGLVSVALAAPDRWAAEIDAFTKADAAHPPPRNAVVFIGSSSIRIWTTLKTDFPDVVSINRGFGGSELGDSAFFVDRIAIPYHPRIVVVYAGDNDLSAGKSPESVFEQFKILSAKIRTALPETRLIFISIKPSPSRWAIHDKMIRTNELIAAECAKDKHCTFLDVYPAMLGADGQPRPELYRDDKLHMKPAGYVIWTKLLAPLLKP